MPGASQCSTKGHNQIIHGIPASPHPLPGARVEGPQAAVPCGPRSPTCTPPPYARQREQRHRAVLDKRFSGTWCREVPDCGQHALLSVRCPDCDGTELMFSGAALRGPARGTCISTLRSALAGDLKGPEYEHEAGDSSDEAELPHSGWELGPLEEADHYQFLQTSYDPGRADPYPYPYLSRRPNLHPASLLACFTPSR